MKMRRWIGLITVLALPFVAPQIAMAHIARKHILVIVQENRTPDNLFQGLCSPPFGDAQSCSTRPDATQYDIKTKNWRNKNSSTGVTQPQPTPLPYQYDLGHTRDSFLAMCDKDSSGACLMDGAASIACFSGPRFTCPPDPQFRFVDNSSGILNPYLKLATRYGWANYMFQTNQGSSFPAHQYLFGGTSAPSASDDADGTFVSDSRSAHTLGCISSADVTATLVTPSGPEKQGIYPCFNHDTIPDLLPAGITWRYYTPAGPSNDAIWNAPLAISPICQSSGPNGQCTGQQYSSNVDLQPADVLMDIAACNLRNLSWVIPTGQNSDHAGVNDGGGPSWVASIVNAIGNSTGCDGNTGYWKNTAILIVWDDWGGWYDHVPPKIRLTVQGDYERGFRVPLIVVSAYTPKGFINNHHLDFGSIIRFIEHNFGIEPGALGFADERAKRGIGRFFDFSMRARRYRNIVVPKTAAFFLNDTRLPAAPDND